MKLAAYPLWETDMKQNTETTVKKSSTLTRPARSHDRDETYLQINKTSFQKNFKDLIGHYHKNESLTIRLSRPAMI
jgi:hypothetical protein